MKKTLSLILALIMLLSVAPITAYADWPMANSLTATNAIDGVCHGTVELSWTPSSTPSDYNHQLCITKSYDGTNFTSIATFTNKVSTTKTYTYTCSKDDYGKTIYFGVQYEMNGSSTLNASHRTAISVLVEAPALGYDKDECDELMLQGLADRRYTKTTEKYDGKKFVVGTKAVWDCKLYTLTAKATKVNGTKVTFNITFKSKIAEGYIGEKGYSINIGSKTYYPEDTINYTVDTSKSDKLATSAICGPQFFTIRVERTQIIDPIIYSSNPYFAGIVSSNEVYPSNSNYISRVYLSDTYALSYNVNPTYKLSPNSYAITKNSITLGTYGFSSIVKYKVSGAKSWTQKSFAKNKKITLSGLKANTVYEIQVYCKVSYKDPETNKSGSYTGTVASTFKLTTSNTAKPNVTSVKISNFKNGKKKTINGYWESDGDWHPKETFNTATYTMTVKVKSAPKTAKGLVLKVGGSTYYATGNKKSYTFKLSYQDKKKIQGKKMKANYYWSNNTISKNPLGLSPGKAVNYKIKNGTTKVK